MAVVIAMEAQGQRQAVEITRGWFPWLLDENILLHLNHAVPFFIWGCQGTENAVTNIHSCKLRQLVRDNS